MDVYAFGRINTRILLIVIYNTEKFRILQFRVYSLEEISNVTDISVLLRIFLKKTSMPKTNRKQIINARQKIAMGIANSGGSQYTEKMLQQKLFVVTLGHTDFLFKHVMLV